MFEVTKENFYQSLGQSIKNRKDILKLKRKDILYDETRVSKIVKNVRNKCSPYLITKGEYPYLHYLFLCEDHDSFIKENIAEEKKGAELKKKYGDNYDKMLWGHIDWDIMFQNFITDLSKLNKSEELGELFEKTLTDFVPYALIQYEKLHPDCARLYIWEDEREKERQHAIEWVHLRHGSTLFKQSFYEKFSGKTLCEFDKGFLEFAKDYLNKRMPDKYSFGKQANTIHNNISGYKAYWQKIVEAQSDDSPCEESSIKELLEEYYKNGREQMKKLKEFQEAFDKLNIKIK